MGVQKINGINIWVDSVGEGDPVVLIHGLTSSYHTMLGIADWLKNEHQVIYYDCRGHGASEKPPYYTLDDHADDLLAIMDFYGLERANVLGMSMGTYIAQAAAIKAPQRIKKLVLLVPKAHGKTSSIQRLLKEAGKDIGTVSAQELGAIMLANTFAPETPEEIKKKMLQANSAATLTAEEKKAVDKALEGFDLREGLPKITAPTLVCSSKYDGINPPEMGKEVAELIPNARFELFEHSGHVLHIEEEPKCRRLVCEFLR